MKPYQYVVHSLSASTKNLSDSIKSPKNSLKINHSSIKSYNSYQTLRYNNSTKSLPGDYCCSTNNQANPLTLRLTQGLSPNQVQKDNENKKMYNEIFPNRPKKKLKLLLHKDYLFGKRKESPNEMCGSLLSERRIPEISKKIDFMQKVCNYAYPKMISHHLKIINTEKEDRIKKANQRLLPLVSKENLLFTIPHLIKEREVSVPSKYPDSIGLETPFRVRHRNKTIGLTKSNKKIEFRPIGIGMISVQ